MKNLEIRISLLEKKVGGKKFAERIEDIFAKKNYHLLTSEDVDNLKQFMPDKFDLLLEVIYKVYSANI